LAAVVTRSTVMTVDAFIQCRVTAAMKSALHAAAVRQQRTDSALVKRMLEIMLQTAGVSDPHVAPAAQPVRIARLSVRLTVEDWALLRERAAARYMASATYASTVLRAQLRALAPLPKEELLALKQSITELSAIGRNLNQIARVANERGRVNGPSPGELHALLNACGGLRNHVRALIKANVTSWTVGHDTHV